MTIATPDTTEMPRAHGVETAFPRRRFSRLAAKITAHVVAWPLVAVFAALVIAGGIAPSPLFLDATKLTILTGSMKGTYNPGDVVVVKPQDVTSYKIGDAVTFQAISGDDKSLTTHRIIAVSFGNGPGSIDGVAGFTTQGDANSVPDEPIEAGQVRGKVLYSVPYIGYASQWFASPPLAKVAVTVGLGLIAASVLSLLPWHRLIRRRSPGH